MSLWPRTTISSLWEPIPPSALHFCTTWWQVDICPWEVLRDPHPQAGQSREPCCLWETHGTPSGNQCVGHAAMSSRKYVLFIFSLLLHRQVKAYRNKQCRPGCQVSLAMFPFSCHSLHHRRTCNSCSSWGFLSTFSHHWVQRHFSHHWFLSSLILFPKAPHFSRECVPNA